MENKKQAIWRYSFGIAIILAGLILNYKDIGREFFAFSSVGNWLIYTGFIMFGIITLQLISGKKRKVDERTQFIGMKSASWTYIFIILAAFVIMIIDGIKPITISYSYFMSYLICGIILVYVLTYKILERRN